MAYQTNIHSFDLYDDKGVLKPTMLLIVLILYTSRYLLLIGFKILSEVSSTHNLLVNLIPSNWLVVPSIFCGLLFISLLLRKEGANSFIKRIWSLGYIILLASLMADFILLSYFFIHGSLLDELFYVVGFIDAVLLAHLLMSSYIRDVFKEFP
jgi:hypothetical protein